MSRADIATLVICAVGIVALLAPGLREAWQYSRTGRVDPPTMCPSPDIRAAEADALEQMFRRLGPPPADRTPETDRDWEGDFLRIAARLTADTERTTP